MCSVGRLLEKSKVKQDTGFGGFQWPPLLERSTSPSSLVEAQEERNREHCMKFGPRERCSAC